MAVSEDGRVSRKVKGYERVALGRERKRARETRDCFRSRSATRTKWLTIQAIQELSGRRLSRMS